MGNVEKNFLMLISNNWSSLTVCLNWIVSVTLQYLKPFNCVQIKLFILESNIWKHLRECNHMIDTK